MHVSCWWDNLPFRSPYERLRRNLAAMGFAEALDMTDEELEEGAVRMAEIVGQAGVTTKQAIQAMKEISCMMKL